MKNDSVYVKITYVKIRTHVRRYDSKIKEVPYIRADRTVHA